MKPEINIDEYLQHKRAQREVIFQDAASTSLLMNGIHFLCRHFYHSLDVYCRMYMKLWFRRKVTSPDDIVLKGIGKLYADAIDTYHALWVGVTFLCYCAGWEIFQNCEGADYEWALWTAPLALCIYRTFESYAALIEMLFRSSESKHHQFRILLHAFLHYLSTGFSFALFYLFTDRYFQTFNADNDAGTATETQFKHMFDPIYDSFLTVVAFSSNDEPYNWLGKLLILIEMFMGFALATFIFLNITQIWAPEQADK
jgi:hypothetical protein